VGDAMRIDRFLWFARLARSRSAAAAIAEQGHVRIDGRRIDRAHAPVRIGQAVTFVQGAKVRVVRVAALPGRRGPYCEARCCYDDLAPVDEPAPQS